MTEWKPKPRADARTEDMNLTGEEGFVLSRVDGVTSLQNLVHLTGLPEGRVRQILSKLVRQGAVEDGSGEPTATVVDEISPEDLAALLNEHSGDDLPLPGDKTTEGDACEPVDLSAPAPAVEASRDPSRDGEDEPAPADEDEPEAPADAASDAEEASHRKLFNTELSKLEAVEREAMAKTAKEPHLSALCFDPLPAVIKHLFENPLAALQHARLVARHHHTPQGIDVVMHRPELFRDSQVQRLLLQNTMLQEPQLKRVLQSKRLIEVYKVTISREIPERNRQKSRTVLRSKWATSEGEERAGLVFTTEGRCLLQLSGLPFDSQTTALLCQKSYASLLLITNLARFGATPPQLLVHLLKQPLVRRQPHLRTLIGQHPNCPADAKRR